LPATTSLDRALRCAGIAPLALVPNLETTCSFHMRARSA